MSEETRALVEAQGRTIAELTALVLEGQAALLQQMRLNTVRMDAVLDFVAQHHGPEAAEALKDQIRAAAAQAEEDARRGGRA